MTIDFGRALLLMNVYHQSVGIPEANYLRDAARMEIAAMGKPVPVPTPTPTPVPTPTPTVTPTASSSIDSLTFHTSPGVKQ
jgi:hypothetical protein